MLGHRLVYRTAGHPTAVQAPMPTTIRARLENFVRWTVVLLGCSIPVSVAADNILLAFILACWFFGGGYRQKFEGLRQNPVALAALAFVALYLAGTLYTIGNEGEVLNMLTKASRFLLIPALMPLMRDEKWRRRGVGAFQASMVVTLVLSYAIWFGVMPASAWIKGTELDPVVFKAHITHNVFMAFAAFVFALAAVEARSLKGRIATAVLCVAAMANVLLMVPGRTGHVVLLVLFTYFLFLQFRTRGIVAAGLALCVLAVAVFVSPDTMLHKRITLADDQLQQWRPDAPPDLKNSIGQRLAILRNTIEVIRDNPVFGVGTGGFGTAYAELANKTGDSLTTNPHNEFLMIIAQFGLAGLALLICVFGTQWWLAAHLSGRFDQAAARGFVLTMVVASILSSTLVDHAEGLFFVYMSALLFAGYGGGWPRRSPDPAHDRGTGATAR